MRFRGSPQDGTGQGNSFGERLARWAVGARRGLPADTDTSFHLRRRSEPAARAEGRRRRSFLRTWAFVLSAICGILAAGLLLDQPLLVALALAGPLPVLACIFLTTGRRPRRR